MQKQARIPMADVWGWQLHAACKGMASSVFYAAYGERGRQKRAREQRARDVCGSCPVRRQCAEFALATDETYGVWGGLTEADRATRPRAGRLPVRRAA
ncbi:WhiB family transcriptional regulator [Streptomyces sp. LZ34]